MQQVEKKYYLREKYANLERFISYFYQIDLIKKTKAHKILFIGVGDSLVVDYLRKNYDLEITTFDIAEDLKPDIIGDIKNLPFGDNQFDLVVAYEVLEHVEFENFNKILEKLSKISKDKVIISLPHRNTAFELIFRFPFIKTLLKKDYIRFLLTIPIKFPGFEISGQHYWEIDNNKFKMDKIKFYINKYFNLLEIKKTLLSPYKCFFILHTKSNINNNYVKEYYNEYLNNEELDYSHDRWFSSKESLLDYEETRDSILKFLNNKTFNNVLEIGPGDGIWTKLLLKNVKQLDLLDQSQEMISRSKNKLKDFQNINYFVEDFANFYNHERDNSYDLIFSIRCFEYIKDKELAIYNMSKMLKKNGKLFIITKNPLHISSRDIHLKKLHSAQITKDEMISVLEKNSLKLDYVYPAVFRLKSKYLLMRIIFKFIHKIFLLFNGYLYFDKIETYLTESYVYLAIKK